MFDGGLARTRTDEVGDGIPQLLKLGQLLLDRRKFLLGPCADRPARRSLPCPERQKLLCLGQAEAELSGAANELKAGHSLIAVPAVPTLWTARLRQDADALVVAHGLDAHPRPPRQSADGEGLVVHAQTVWGLYRTIGSRGSDHVSPQRRMTPFKKKQFGFKEQLGLRRRKHDPAPLEAEACLLVSANLDGRTARREPAPRS